MSSPQPSRSVLGRRSRSKGKSFELVVRDAILFAFRDSGLTMTIRRSSQAERAYDSDVVVVGDQLPDFLADVWWECQHSKQPDPPTKYEQAVRDCEVFYDRTRRCRWPVVVWRKHGERTLWLTTELGTIVSLLGNPSTTVGRQQKILATVRLDEFLEQLASRVVLPT